MKRIGLFRQNLPPHRKIQSFETGKRLAHFRTCPAGWQLEEYSAGCGQYRQRHGYSSCKRGKKGDTTLTLKDSAGWKNGAYLQVKFNTKPDLSDLPNREGIPFSRIEGNIVTLKTSLRKDYPAGTAVRQHESGNSYMYSGAAYQNVPADKWVEFAGEISGESRSGISPRQFWRGTRMVKIMMLTNQHDVMFKDISLDEIE